MEVTERTLHLLINKTLSEATFDQNHEICWSQNNGILHTTIAGK
jgi:hypothetical protein